MNLPVKIRVKQVKKEMLFEAYKHKEVLIYCQRCNNYGKNYSCPDFSFDAVTYLEPYKYATIIVTEVDTQQIQAQLDQLDPDQLESRVRSNYLIEEPDQKIDLKSIVSMYAFEDIKNQMADQLLALEKKIDDSMGLPPGSCTRCATCTKILGDPCRFPETLRYSLEALGFLVSEIYKQFFDLELAWTKDELPSSFCSCSALMTKEKCDESMILGSIEGMMLRINEDGV
jgi:predicted metal-binding protein